MLSFQFVVDCVSVCCIKLGRMLCSLDTDDQLKMKCVDVMPKRDYSLQTKTIVRIIIIISCMSCQHETLTPQFTWSRV
jgi:hypothetical protein